VADFPEPEPKHDLVVVKVMASAIDLFCRGLDPSPMVTHRFGIEDALEAFEAFFGGRGAKVMIEPWS
jgi:hypothetical protein